LLAHVRELLGRQPGRLVEHLLADADLPHVVQAPREADLLDDLVVQPEFGRDRGRRGRHPVGVSAQVGALRLQRVDQGLRNAGRERLDLAQLIAGEPQLNRIS
jgi:hypothetical protein